MREFNQSSSPAEFQAEYRKLRDRVFHLKEESDAESTRTISTLTDSCSQLEHLIRIITDTMEVLHEWREALTKEQNLLQPPPKRAQEIVEDIRELDRQTAQLEAAKKHDESSLAAALICLKLESSQNLHDASPAPHEDQSEPKSSFGLG